MRFRTQRGTEEGDHHNWDIGDVLTHYGWDGVAKGSGRWLRTRCPFHLDREPSAGISYDLNAYRCFSCDRAGNSVSLVMSEEGLDAREAVEWLAAHVGGDAPAPGGPVPESHARKGPRIPWEPMTLR